MNAWADVLGCEVNLCLASYCDKVRMEGCALRKYYKEAVARALYCLGRCKSEAAKDKYRKILRGLDYAETEK